MSQEPFGDIPLFREIQKILASSDGPINFEIARQIAGAVATEGRADSAAGPEVERTLADGVHAAEALLSGYTRMPLVEPARAESIGRGTWASDTLDGWRWLLERLARHFTAELTRMGESEAGGNPMQSMMGQMSPLLMGMQTGTLIGHLGKEALGRYDFAIPRDDAGHLFFVASNLDQVASDYGVEAAGVQRWMAAHDAARHLVMNAVPWAGRYLRSLLAEVVDAIELDIAGLERRLMEIQGRGMEAIQEGVGAEAVLPIAPTERHNKALDRLRSFLAVFEGYASEALKAVGPELVGDGGRIAEAMMRRQASPTEGEAMLGNLLGVALDRQLEVSGATFCAAVAKLKGLAALNQVWDAPDNLPVIDEIRDPFAWMERVLGE